MVLGPPGIVQGTAEVEFGFEGILDAPRNLLDSVAVLCNRYGAKKKALVCLVVASALPNQRSEYWQLIRDIADVLDLRIGTVTWASLMVLVWERRQLKLSPNNELYADTTTFSIRKQIESLLGRSSILHQAIKVS